VKVILARLYPSPEIDLVSENIWDDEALRRYVADGIAMEARLLVSLEHMALPVGPEPPVRLRLTAREVKKAKPEGGGPA